MDPGVKFVLNCTFKVTSLPAKPVLVFSARANKQQTTKGLESAHFGDFGTPRGRTFRPWLRRYSAQTRKNVVKNQKKVYFFRTRPNASVSIRMHLDASRRVPMYPNGSPQVRKLPKTYENIEKLAKISRKF